MVQSQFISRANLRSRRNPITIALTQSREVSATSTLYATMNLESTYMYTVEDLTRLRLQAEDERNVFADLLAEKLKFFDNHFLPIEYDRISVNEITFVADYEDTGTASPSSSATTPEEVVVAITAAVRF